jgi:hypothetical protein
MLDNNAPFLSKNIDCRVFSPNAYIAEGLAVAWCKKKIISKSLYQSFGSGTINSRSASFSNFKDTQLQAVLRIRNKSFGSGSDLKLVSDPDSNPDPNPGFGSRSETGQNFFFCSKFLPILIFKHKRLPSLSSVTWLQKRCAINLQDSDPDPLIRGTDPRTRVRTKKSRIHYTAYNYLK